MSGFMPGGAVDPEIRGTFRVDADEYISRNAGGFISCPPSVIARCAAHRVAPESLTLPAGYSQESLAQIMAITGFVDQDVRISGRQAEELAQMGEQLLKLHSAGKVQPPLGPFEEQSVAHLLDTVSWARE
ncbi:hypothetical protein ACWEKM_27730 [Streptomyces sp. NPDC004752]